MNEIEEFRRRLAAAQQRQAREEEARRSFGDRLMGSIGALETALGRKQEDVDRLDRENRELRSMLYDALLLGMGAGPDRLGATVRELEARVNAIAAAPSRPEPFVAPDDAPPPAADDAPSSEDMFRAAMLGEDAVAAMLERMQAKARRRHGEQR